MKAPALVLVIAAVAACGRPSSQSQSPSPSPSPSSAPSSPERALCLADAPAGEGAVDKLLADRRRAVDGLPTRMDLWVLLGRAWV